jgi:hypothetical protein
MATISVEQINKLKEAIPQLSESLQKLISDQSKVKDGAVQASEALRVISSNFSTSGTAVSSYSEKLNELIKSFDLNLNNLGSQILDTQTATGKMALSTVSALEPIVFNVLPKGTAAFGEFANAGTRAGQQLQTEFGILKPIIDTIIKRIPYLGKFGSKLPKGISNLLATADAANNLQVGIAGVISQSGQLNNVINSQTGEFKNLNDVTSSFVKNSFNVAQATGTSLDQTMNYAKALSAIPDAADAAIVKINGFGRTMSNLEATMKVASAFGLQTSSAIETMKRAYMDFNATGAKAIQLLTNVGTAAQTLKLPFDSVQGYVMDTASQFKMLGDNSQGALKILKAFTPALRDSGLGSAAIKEVVSGLTGGLKSMDTAHKAFISGASGGRRGVAGAIQMDALMRAGNMAEVMKRTMSAMTRTMGGPMVSVEDAAKDPSKAGQLLKQRELLKSFGLARDDATADRVIDAMKAGSADKLGDIINEGRESDAKRLETTMRRGHQLQMYGNTKLTDIANKMKMASVVQGMVNAGTARKFIGGKASEEIANLAGGAATGDMFGTKGKTTETFANLQDEITDMVNDTTKAIQGKGSELGKSIMSMAKSLPGVGTILDSAQKRASKIKTAAAILKIQGANAAFPLKPNTSIIPTVPKATLPKSISNEAAIRAFQATGKAPDTISPINVKVPPLNGTIDINVKVDGLGEVVSKEVKARLGAINTKVHTGA